MTFSRFLGFYDPFFLLSAKTMLFVHRFVAFLDPLSHFCSDVQYGGPLDKNPDVQTEGRNRVSLEVHFFPRSVEEALHPVRAPAAAAPADDEGGRKAKEGIVRVSERASSGARFRWKILVL